MKKIAIIGAGLTGLAFVNFMKRSKAKFFLFESKKINPEKNQFYGRHIVLSNSSKEILIKIGLWEEIKKDITKIKNIHVSRMGAFGSTLVKSEDEEVDSLGYQIDLGVLYNIFFKNALTLENIEFIDNFRVEDVLPGTKCKIVSKDFDDTIPNTFDSIVFSGGQLDSLYRKFFGEKVCKDYNQTAFVSEIFFDKKPSSTAYERFTDMGIIALLPRKESWTLIYSINNSYLKNLQNNNKELVKDFIQKDIGYRCGKIKGISNEIFIPLSLEYYEQFSERNLCLLGDAAHKLHPIAGQSYNLTLRDILVLSELFKKYDFNNFNLIFKKFLIERDKDIKSTIKFTDSMATQLSDLDFIRSKLVGLSLFLMDTNKKIKLNSIRYITGAKPLDSNLTNL